MACVLCFCGDLDVALTSTARAGSLSVATQFARRSRASARYARVATERRVVAVTMAAASLTMNFVATVASLDLKKRSVHGTATVWTVRATGSASLGAFSLHVSCMYLARILIIHQDTSRYISDTSRYICICHFGYHRKCILPRDMYPSLRYIQNTFRIHSRYNVS